VGATYVPAHSSDRILRLTLRKITELPRCRTGTSGCIDEVCHRIVEGNRPAIFDERKLPILALLISPCRHEVFEFRVGDFVLIDEIVTESDGLEMIETGNSQIDHASWNVNRLRRNRSFAIEHGHQRLARTPWIDSIRRLKSALFVFSEV